MRRGPPAWATLTVKQRVRGSEHGRHDGHSGRHGRRRHRSAGAPGRRGRRGRADRRGRREPPRRRRARRRRPRGRPRLHRHPHPLRRPGLLGPGPDALVLPRRHDGGRRQLRLLHRSDEARATASWSPTPSRRWRTWTRPRSSPASRGTSRPSPSTWPRSSGGARCSTTRPSWATRPCGSTSWVPRPPTGPRRRDEIARMAGLVGEAMDAGAAGVATSFAITHLGADGRPIPSRLAQKDELAAIFGAVGDSGRGVVGINGGKGLTLRDVLRHAAGHGRPRHLHRAAHHGRRLPPQGPRHPPCRAHEGGRRLARRSRAAPCRSRC